MKRFAPLPPLVGGLDFSCIYNIMSLMSVLNIVHFTKADLVKLPSCFLDPKGNFVYIYGGEVIGVHEELAGEILDEQFGEDFHCDNYEAIRACGTYTYSYFEQVLGWFRYSHWVGTYGKFNGEKSKMTYAQKSAIREFCRVNGATWYEVAD